MINNDDRQDPSRIADRQLAHKNNNMQQDRRSDYDVTNTVQVSNPVAVRSAVHDLFADTWPSFSFDKVWLAFYDFERLFTGRLPDYIGCDTTYHDMQHTLDMTLALARLVVGYERSAEASERIGGERAQMAIITSLFHDSGYIRHKERDRGYNNGAELTLYHVSRSADFLRRYLPTIGLSKDVAISSIIVHYTGYEVDLNEIELDDPRDTVCGHLLGTADLIAQMADRCYLEKCRDYLYSEFVLGGIAIENATPGHYMIRYKSGVDLLKQTPDFFEHVTKGRLERQFGRSYRYLEVLFDGGNPYLVAIKNNMRYLQRLNQSGDWALLRRQPECISVKGTREMVSKMVQSQLDALSGMFEMKGELSTAVVGG